MFHKNTVGRVKRGLICLYACLWIIGLPLHTTYAAQNNILLVIDGREIAGLPMPPTLYQNSILVPAREVFENLGAVVHWEANTRSVHISYQQHTLVMTIDRKTAMLDGVERTMQIPPLIINGKTMIPLRFPAECFGFEVSWRENERTAYIYTPLPEPENTPPPATETPGMADTSPIIPLPVETEEAPSVGSVPPVSVTQELTVLAQDISKADIPKAAYAETVITALLTPYENRTAAYTAVASSPISEVQKFLLPDSRLVVDIYNAKCGISGPFYMDASVPVSGVRASQFMDTPKVTRVVFDITGAAEYSVSLSPDRTMLTVSFSRNIITGVAFTTNGLSDTITITGVSTPVVSIYPLTEPSRIAIFINNTLMGYAGAETVNGAYVTGYGAWQLDDGSGYVEAAIREFSSYDVTYGTNTATVRFFPNTYQNIAYDRQNHMITIPKSSGLRMDINGIIHSDDYTNYRYLFTLPVDAEAVLGQGEFIIQDGYIHSVIIERDVQGFTRLAVNEARVLAFTVHENNDYYFIKAHLPRELYPRVVVVDPGHGGSAPGTLSVTGVSEKTINLGIALKLMQLLDADPSIKAYATRLTDVAVPLEDRPLYANAVGDLFVSIHANSAQNNTAASGTETWYWPHYNDDALRFTSKQFATIMQNRLIAMLGSVNRQIKSDELVVLRDTTIPAILCEIGFMTNLEETAKLMNDNYQWLAAQAIYQGIIEAFTQYTPAR